MKSFLGAWPKLLEVLDADAGRRVSQRAGGQERRAVRLTRETQVLPGGEHVTLERAAFLELISHRVLSDDESEWALHIYSYKAIEMSGSRRGSRWRRLASPEQASRLQPVPYRD